MDDLTNIFHTSQTSGDAASKSVVVTTTNQDLPHIKMPLRFTSYDSSNTSSALDTTKTEYRAVL
ncbi:hypothetical protein Hamer_G004839 [Homarus americanus]|uniref:Uncharacterized protein n=1 Tax=Homarus americanus TaxID=6706 RepID=A0A8J5JVR6_HOMAM|nr:hypothetical protein Hamer_G004839 [Homarus americanus]